MVVKTLSKDGTIEIKTESSKECERKVRLSNALSVPDNSKNLVSVSKLRSADYEVLFGKDLEKRKKNGTLFTFKQHDSLFLWKTVNSRGSKNYDFASGDGLSLRPKCLGYNFIEDFLKI